jgi:hypothetical protein
VISDSSPWKSELERLEVRLRRLCTKKWSDKFSSFKYERDIFYAAYVVRKLIEAVRVSDECEAYRIEAIEYAPTTKVSDLLNRDNIDELFDLSEGKSCRLGLREFCNQIIHSFIFAPCFDEELSVLTGLFVASDRQRSACLLYFEIENVIGLVHEVSQDDIVDMQMVRDRNTKQWIITKKTSYRRSAMNIAPPLHLPPKSRSI